MIWGILAPVSMSNVYIRFCSFCYLLDFSAWLQLVWPWFLPLICGLLLDRVPMISYLYSTVQPPGAMPGFSRDIILLKFYKITPQSSPSKYTILNIEHIKRNIKIDKYSALFKRTIH
jgi:hypothetical protein